MNLRRKTLKLMGSHIDILIFDSIDAENILTVDLKIGTSFK